MRSRGSKASLLAVLCLMWTAQSPAAPAQKKFGIVRLAFSQSEDGEVLYFSCQVEGYSKTEKDEIRLTFQVEAKDANGVLLQAPTNGKVETNLSPEDKDWLPKLRATILIPPLLPPGEYQMLAKVK